MQKGRNEDKSGDYEGHNARPYRCEVEDNGEDNRKSAVVLEGYRDLIVRAPKGNLEDKWAMIHDGKKAEGATQSG